MPLEVDAFFVHIYMYGRVDDQAYAGGARQRRQIDMDIVVAIVPRNVARQHARIRRAGFARGQRHARAGQRVPREVTQHERVAMATAH